MDARSQALLEFPLVRDRLAAATSFPPSRRLAEALEPSTDPVIVARRLDETDQTRALLEERPGVGIGAAHDIGPSIERAARGGRLEPGQFLEIADTLDATARLATSLADERRPLLRDLGRELHPLPALRTTLARSFDPVGELLDTASPRLGGLRAAVRVAYDRLRRRLDALVGAELGSALQEPIVTLRNGRYVVPVKAEARARVKGIVHDASGSGQTLFVEPLVAVELGNAWREAQVAEHEEIARILDELSALVAANADALRETLDALARFDLWAAKAAARRRDGRRSAPRPPTGPRSCSCRPAIPGLTGRVVPIDIRIGDGYTALVVTGPNTGGKTVTLRTLGLLSLMHQSGLHVPAAAGSRLPVWRDVFADIGDEQSIAQSLSTFSGHLRRITTIVEEAGPGHARPARRARRRHRPDRGLGAGAGAARPLHPGRRARRGHDPLRRAQGLRPHDARRPQRRGRVRPRDAVADVPPDDRPARRQPGVRDRRAAGPARGDRRRRPVAADRGAALVRGDARRRSRRPRARRARRSSGRGPPRRAPPRRCGRPRRSGAGRDASATRRSGRRATEADRVVERPARRAAATRARRSSARRSPRRRSTRRWPAPRRIAERLPAASSDRRAGPGRAAPPRLAGRRAGAQPDAAAGRAGSRRSSEGGRRATLEAGGMRVTVELDDLEPALGVPAAPAVRAIGADGRRRRRTPRRCRLERARTVASSLDLRGARVEEALEALDRYLDDAALAGLG